MVSETATAIVSRWTFQIDVAVPDRLGDSEGDRLAVVDSLEVPDIDGVCDRDGRLCRAGRSRWACTSRVAR